jgi:hypothetical protein
VIRKSDDDPVVVKKVVVVAEEAKRLVAVALPRIALVAKSELIVPTVVDEVLKTD